LEILMHRSWLLVLAVAALPFGGCFQPDQPPCAFSCGDNNVCPTGYSCLDDGYCHRAGHTGSCGFTDLSANVSDLSGLDLAPEDLTMPTDGMLDGPGLCTTQAECGAGKHCTNLAGGTCASCSSTDPTICGTASTAAGCLQCTGTTPVCAAGACTACTTHAQCGVGKFCNVGTGACGSCGLTDAARCGTSATAAGCNVCAGVTPICTGGACVGCTMNAQCGTGNYCDTGSGACLACSMTDPNHCGTAASPAGCLPMCTSTTPICSGGACTACTMDAQCGTGNFCNTSTGACIACSMTDRLHCGTSATPAGCLSVCSGACVAGACAACTSNPQCSAGTYCDVGATGNCLSCGLIDDAHCGGPTTPAGCMACNPPTTTCVAGACFP
jgi:Cys-rich repeat protein